VQSSGIRENIPVRQSNARTNYWLFSRPLSYPKILMGETWATAFHPISSGISKLCPKIVNGREKLTYETSLFTSCAN